MKLSTPFANLLIASTYAAAVVGQAFSPVSTVTGTAASTTATSAALAGICPAYDGKNFTDGNSALYSVHCDAYANSEDEYEVTDPTSPTAVQCMDVCEEFDGCAGAVYYPGSRCVLTIGTTYGWQKNSSGVAYFIRQGGPASISSTTATSSSTAPSTSSAITSSWSTSASSVPNSAQSCNASNIQCPACDSQTVTDHNGTSYNVYCDYHLDTSSVYDVQAYTSASGCLLHCDDYAWCMGATVWEGGNCQLAKISGPPVPDAGYTAFVPVGNADQTASLSSIAASTSVGAKSVTASMSATSAKSMVNTAGATFIPDGALSTAASVTSSSVSASATALSASCPASDGLNVTDVVNQTYTVTCDYEPICETYVNITTTYYTQNACLERCDEDAVCLAALWNNGSCDLCEGSISGLKDYDASSETVVFLSRAVAEELDQPVSAVGSQASATASPTSSTSLLRPMPYATGVSSAIATSSSTQTSSVSKPKTAPGIYVPPSSSSTTLASTGPVPISTTLTTFTTAASSSISTIPASFSPSTSSSSVASVNDAYYYSATTIPSTSSARQAQTLMTAAASSRTQAGYEASTMTDWSSEYPTAGTSTSTSSSFVPPLTSGSVSYAKRG